MHINKINNKKYIGQTKQSLTRRFRQGQGYKHNEYFYSAIQKYGWDNFDHILIKDNLTLEQANKLERQLIKQYNTTNKEKGYNIALGGQGFFNLSSEKISQKNKDNWQNGVYNNIKNKVYCIQLQKYFDSALQAQRELNIDNSAIQKACHGKVKYAGKINERPVHWLFAEEVTPEKIKQLKSRKEEIKGSNIKRICVETGVVYNSAKEIKQLLHIDPSNIGKACKDSKRTAGGYHWKYYYE